MFIVFRRHFKLTVIRAKTKVKKLGGSTVVCIPATIRTLMGLVVGDSVTVTLTDDNEIIISKDDRSTNASRP